MYLIWSIEHDAWWGPDQTGYTRSLALAGRYDHATALAIVLDANGADVNGFPKRFAECLIPLECLLEIRPA